VSEHQEVRQGLGSYVLGALDPAERERVETHLASCAACREELSSFAGLPGLLSRLSLQEVQASSLLPPPSLMDTVLQAVRRERAAERRRLQRWRLASAGLAAAAAAAVAFSVAPRLLEDSPPERRLVAVYGSPAQGSVILHQRAWGSSVELRLEQLPPAEAYIAYATSSSGERTPVASWGPTDTGRANLTGAISVQPDAVRSLTVETTEGRRLLDLPV